MSETVKKENDMTETVKFNVGGTIYEVSRSLLERYPDTMLAKSASERCQEDSRSEIFIERDGDLFRHVLSYLRDGRVVLPLTASREGLMLELQYYGLDGVEKENIDDSLILMNLLNLKTNTVLLIKHPVNDLRSTFHL